MCLHLATKSRNIAIFYSLVFRFYILWNWTKQFNFSDEPSPAERVKPMQTCCVQTCPAFSRLVRWLWICLLAVRHFVTFIWESHWVAPISWHATTRRNSFNVMRLMPLVRLQNIINELTKLKSTKCHTRHQHKGLRKTSSSMSWTPLLFTKKSHLVLESNDLLQWFVPYLFSSPIYSWKLLKF